MKDKAEVNEQLNDWISTYGLITMQRILAHYPIKLSVIDLVQVLKNRQGFFYQILEIPLHLVFDGIILQQAKDYELFAQKLFIDYLISGEANKDASQSGAFTREELEIQRVALVKLSEQFQEIALEHQNLIAKCQKAIIHYIYNWQIKLAITAGSMNLEMQDAANFAIEEKEMMDVLHRLISSYDLKKERIEKNIWADIDNLLNANMDESWQAFFMENLKPLCFIEPKLQETLQQFKEQTQVSHEKISAFRRDFSQIIVKSKELLTQLPDYYPNQSQLEKNYEDLYFDASLGE